MTQVRPAVSAAPTLLSALWGFRAYGRPHLKALLGGVGLRVGELIADLAQPWPLAIVVDGVLTRHRLHGILQTVSEPFSGSRTELLVAAVAASVVLAVASGVFDYLGDRVANGAGERITAAVRHDLFAHLQRLPLAFHETQSVGELTSRVTVDTDNIEDALIDVFSVLIPGLLSIAGLLIMLLLLSWPLGLVAAVTAPFVFGVAARYTRLSRQAASVRRASEGSLAGLVAETLTGIRTVHALGRHDLHDHRFSESNELTLRAGLRAVELRARFVPMIEITAAFGAGAVLWIGASGVLRGAWSLGTLLVAITYIRNMLKPMRSLAKLSLTLSRASASAARVNTILAEPSRLTNESSNPTTTVVRGRIALDHVWFTYGRQPILHDLSLDVAPGERVALVGANGAGKSTVIALLAGLYEPTAGDVCIDGVSLRCCTPEWFQSQVAVVLQDTFLFSGTLWDNIAYGQPAASDKDIRRVAEQARVAEFAEHLPNGYQTVLGDSGVGLSGGQGQRVAIARALLRNAPIVLLDEPTSGLDSTAEDALVQGLRHLMIGKTVVMTTHRPALLELAERILVIDNGALLPADATPVHSAPTFPPPPANHLDER